MRRRIAAAAAGAFLLAGCDGTRSPAPSPVVNAFYAIRIGSSMTGAPTEAELLRIAPFLSDTLAALLKGARALHDREATRVPDDKPPFTEGDLFSSLFEGPQSFSIVPDSVAARNHRVVVMFMYTGDAKPYTWTDTVVIARQKRHDVIDDIAYGGAGEFGNHGTLRAMLERALRGE